MEVLFRIHFVKRFGCWNRVTGRRGVFSLSRRDMAQTMAPITCRQVISPGSWRKVQLLQKVKSFPKSVSSQYRRGSWRSEVLRTRPSLSSVFGGSGWPAWRTVLAVMVVLTTVTFTHAESHAEVPVENKQADPDAAIKNTLSPADQLKLYDEVLHILGGNANIISRWVGDIRFASVGDVDNRIHAMALETVTAVAGDVGLPVVPIEHAVHSSADYLSAVEKTARFDLALCDRRDGESCANLVVVFSDASTMRTLAREIPLRALYAKALDKTADIACFFSPFIDGGMVIRQAFVYVNTNLSTQMVKTCLQEEIYQSFGLFNDVSGSKFFSFNNVVEPKSITEYDRMLLRQVYHPLHRPGAPVFSVVMYMMRYLGYGHFER